MRKVMSRSLIRRDVSYVLEAAMCNVTSDPKSFFPINGNLTKIGWAHAVNDQADLTAALESVNVMMLEADVVLGKLNGNANMSQNMIPIMAHPPATTSNLSLNDFLQAVINKKNVTKGIKLDFKTYEAFNASKDVLNQFHDDIKFPVFINADILLGPVNATTEPVDAKKFLSEAKMIANCTLSLGWTTRYGEKDKITDGGYTENQVQQMIDLLKEEKPSQPITYPVRAGPAANNITVIKSLMEKSANISNDVTLTIWSSKGDTVNAQQLSTLIKDIGIDKVYVDVPKDLMNNLNFSAASRIGIATMTIAVSMITVFLSTIM